MRQRRGEEEPEEESLWVSAAAQKGASCVPFLLSSSLHQRGNEFTQLPATSHFTATFVNPQSVNPLFLKVE